jgi:hypothetical protein
MPQDIEKKPVQKMRSPLSVIVICASISVLIQYTGLFSFFFLVPVGFAVMVSDSFYRTVLLMTGFFIVLSLFISLIVSGSANIPLIEFIYTVILIFGFSWIMAGSKYTNVRTAYRFILSASAGFIVFLAVFLGAGKDSSLHSALYSQAEFISSIIIASAGNDAVRVSELQKVLTPENIVESFKSIFLKGGAILTFFFVFFINRHLSLIALWLIKKQKYGRRLSAFFAPANTVWLLCASAALLLFTRQLKMETAEIVAWNVLAVCGIIFLAQGAGILMHFLETRAPAFRLMANVFIIVLILSPGINTVAIAALLLLGVIENWVPLRQPKTVPTPGQ